jgi:hypothetical protein
MFAAGADVRADLPQPLTTALTTALASRLATVPAVRGAMPVVVVPSATNAGSSLLALDASQAARIALLRPDQSPLPAAMLFRKMQPVSRPGVSLGGQTAEIRLTAAFGPAGLNLAAAAVTITIDDADGDSYQLAMGTLPADGRPHPLTVRVAPAGRHVLGPLRVTAIAVGYRLPAIQSAQPATFRVLSVNSAAGTAVSGFTAGVSAPELTALSQSNAVAGPYSPPQLISSRAGADGSWTTTFVAGYGTAAASGPRLPTTPIPAELDLAVPARLTATIPGIATQAFVAANNLGVGDTVAATVGGGALSVTLVAVVATFPTVTAADGAVIVDLPSVQDGLASQSLAPLPVTEWWLSSAGHQVPPLLPGVLPPGAAVTSAAGLAAGSRRHQRGRTGRRARHRPDDRRAAAGAAVGAGRRHAAGAGRGGRHRAQARPRASHRTGRARCSPIRVSSRPCRPSSACSPCSSPGSSRSASQACRRTRFLSWSIRSTTCRARP